MSIVCFCFRILILCVALVDFCFADYSDVKEADMHYASQMVRHAYDYVKETKQPAAQKALQDAGLSHIRPIPGDKGDALGFLAQDNEGNVHIVFKGTSTLGDVLVDAKNVWAVCHETGLRCHQGALSVFQGFFPFIQGALDDMDRLAMDGVKITVYGHSLASFFAKMTAYCLRQKGYDVAVFTFADFRFFDKISAIAYDDVLKEQTCTVLACDDFVSRYGPIDYSSLLQLAVKSYQEYKNWQQHHFSDIALSLINKLLFSSKSLPLYMAYLTSGQHTGQIFYIDGSFHGIADFEQ